MTHTDKPIDMPTPVKYYTKVAQKWGNIDPDDYQAVENWFLNDFPNLPKKELSAILDELIEKSNEVSIDPGKITNPPKVPMPLFKDNIPVSGYAWLNSYKGLKKYLRSLIKSKSTTHS